MSESPAPSVPLAAIDVGSNTVHLAVARPLPDRFDLELLADETEMVRFGADINATGQIGPERLEKALGVLNNQVHTAHQHGATALLGIATEGVRAASNSAEVRDRIARETGLDLCIVTGEQEAALTYWGAISGEEPLARRRAVLDLGGGSMEVVVGTGTHVEWRVSLPLGSGAMHDKYAFADPPQADQLERVRQVTSDTLAKEAVPLPVHEVIAVGGTATILAIYALRSPAIPDPENMSPPGTPFLHTRLGWLTAAQLATIIAELEKVPSSEVANRYDISPARAPLLAAGAEVLRTTLARLGADRMRISRRGIREGAILAYSRSGDGWLDAATSGAGWADGARHNPA